VTLHKGWFEATLPAFDRGFDVALLDVDLLASTRSCLAHLLPLRKPDGVIYSQDGHLRLIVDFLADTQSWRAMGSRQPMVVGLGERKFLRLDFPLPGDGVDY
jgi:O-methyltransferase